MAGNKILATTCLFAVTACLHFFTLNHAETQSLLLCILLFILASCVILLTLSVVLLTYHLIVTVSCCQCPTNPLFPMFQLSQFTSCLPGPVVSYGRLGSAPVEKPHKSLNNTSCLQAYVKEQFHDINIFGANYLQLITVTTNSFS